MIPGTIMYVYIGASLGSLAEATSKRETTSPAETILYWFGLAATTAVTIFVTRIAKKALKQVVLNNDISQKIDSAKETS